MIGPQMAVDLGAKRERKTKHVAIAGRKIRKRAKWLAEILSKKEKVAG